MALKYLLGADVETDSTRERARLLGINNETYVYHCNSLGNDHYPNCETMYCFNLKEKMQAVLDENNDHVLDELGNPTFSGTGSFCLEIDDTQSEYSDLPSIHANRLVSRATMEAEGWFANE